MKHNTMKVLSKVSSIQRVCSPAGAMGFLFPVTLVNSSVCRCSLFQGYPTCLSSGLAAREASVGSSRAPVDSEWALFVPVEDFIYVRHICMIL
uniref:Uncharacterized protein n=1 Tax=Aegilops tauschii subsp. strangulata TaxID=200361 RepID=A0A453DW49_AEGTS